MTTRVLMSCLLGCLLPIFATRCDRNDCLVYPSPELSWSGAGCQGSARQPFVAATDGLRYHEPRPPDASIHSDGLLDRFRARRCAWVAQTQTRLILVVHHWTLHRSTMFRETKPVGLQRLLPRGRLSSPVNSDV